MNCDDWNFRTASFSCRAALSDGLRAIYLKPDFTKVCHPPTSFSLCHSLPFFPLPLLPPTLPPSLPPFLPPSLPSSLPPSLPSLPPPSLLSLFLYLYLPLYITTSCRVMCATHKHSMLVKRLHVHKRHMRITCYDFQTRGRESHSGELVTASERNTSLVIRITCELIFVFFLNLVPSLNDEKKNRSKNTIIHCGTQWSCDCHVVVT